MVFNDGSLGRNARIMSYHVHSLSEDGSEASYTSARQAGHTRPMRRSASVSSTRSKARDPGPSRRGSKDSVYHPLKAGPSSSSSPAAAAGAGVKAPPNGNGVTRPRLEKLVSRMDSWGADDGCSSNGEDGEPSLSRTADEKLVLVHQISPKDSLAGVALKYGVTMSELRRANQLWSTDSIHLRKVLYVPVRADAAQTYARSDDPTHAVRRVPTSRLSFFPPPTARPHTPEPKPTGARTGSRAPSPAIATAPLPARASPRASLDIGGTAQHARAGTLSSLAQVLGSAPAPRPSYHRLSSLFAGMPLAARLSLDSSRSDSDAGTEHDEHELDDVSHASSARRPPPQRPRRAPPPVSATSSASSSSFVSASAPVADGNGPWPQLHREDRWDKARPRSRLPYCPPTPPPLPPLAPRTVQLEPSPTMQLPTLRRRLKAPEQVVDIQSNLVIRLSEQGAGVDMDRSGGDL